MAVIVSLHPMSPHCPTISGHTRSPGLRTLFIITGDTKKSCIFLAEQRKVRNFGENNKNEAHDYARQLQPGVR